MGQILQRQFETELSTVSILKPQQTHMTAHLHRLKPVKQVYQKVDCSAETKVRFENWYTTHTPHRDCSDEILLNKIDRITTKKLNTLLFPQTFENV